MDFSEFELQALLQALDTFIKENGEDYYTYVLSKTGDHVNLIELEKKVKNCL